MCRGSPEICGAQRTCALPNLSPSQNGHTGRKISVTLTIAFESTGRCPTTDMLKALAALSGRRTGQQALAEVNKRKKANKPRVASQMGEGEETLMEEHALIMNTCGVIERQSHSSHMTG